MSVEFKVTQIYTYVSVLGYVKGMVLGIKGFTKRILNPANTCKISTANARSGLKLRFCLC